MAAFHEKTTVAAQGKWAGILAEVGIPDSFLRDRHGPCPMCGGRDRFRWDNKEGSGSFICSRCGAGDGMRLAMLFTGLPFADAASRVDEIIRNVKPDAQTSRREMTDDERRARLNATWRAALRSEPGDLLRRYLGSRGLPTDEVSPELRFSPALKDGEGGVRPAFLARVTASDGKPATLHRTFLRPDGMAKAEMESPRKLMPAPVPEGSAVRLGPIGEVMGIAEGVETALAASVLYEVPVWAAISSTILEKWVPPDGCREVIVFGDTDPGFGGQAAAYGLAKRLAAKGFDVTVRLPPVVGWDWNDVLIAQQGETAA